MGISSGLFAGVSGLNANGAALGVIGNNIANVNTVGFKKSTISFADILSSSSGSAGQIGRGVFLNEVGTDFAQGSFENTSNVLDLGIEGKGFFMVNNKSGGSFYTRAGKFHVDQSGVVVTPDGMSLQGITADSTGNLSGSVGSIGVSNASALPNQTSTINVSANLDSRAATIAPVVFDVNNPTTTSNFSTTINVYDSLGSPHAVAVYFRKAAVNSWTWHAVVDSKDNANGTGDQEQASGTLSFNTSGALSAETTLAPPTGGFDFVGGASTNQAINIDFGNSIAEVGASGGLDGTTQFGTASSVISQDQNGYSSGALQSFSVNQDGVITGLFTNGRSRVLAQLQMAVFESPTGLTKLGNNIYAESFESGQPSTGVPNAAGRGSIVSNTLELSNVDLAAEFINLITAQRGFQANSRIITTTDAMMAELVNLKR